MSKEGTAKTAEFKTTLDILKEYKGGIDFFEAFTDNEIGHIQAVMLQLLISRMASQSPAAGVWVKASEDGPPKAKEHEKLIIKYKDNPDILVMIDNRWCWFEKDLKTSSQFVVQDCSWSEIKYLAESPSGQEQGQAVALTEEIARLKRLIKRMYEGESLPDNYEEFEYLNNL